MLGWAQLTGGVDVRANVGWVGAHLARPLVALLGWPGALLVPLVPAVHALRAFGRLRSDADRSWMIFLAGLVLVVPVAVGVASGLRLATIDGGVGHLGGDGRLLLALLVRRTRRLDRGRPGAERSHGGDAGLES